MASSVSFLDDEVRRSPAGPSLTRSEGFNSPSVDSGTLPPCPLLAEEPRAGAIGDYDQRIVEVSSHSAPTCWTRTPGLRALGAVGSFVRLASVLADAAAALCGRCFSTVLRDAGCFTVRLRCRTSMRSMTFCLDGTAGPARGGATTCFVLSIDTTAVRWRTSRSSWIEVGHHRSNDVLGHAEHRRHALRSVGESKNTCEHLATGR